MAETSYPFSDDSAGGGGKLVSQLDWQKMAHLWGPDRVDFRLGNQSYSGGALPLNVTLSGANVVVSPGSAWVGGFYYTLDAPLNIPAPTNSGANPRIDAVVIRTNLATGSVNLAISTGVASSTPVEPTPQRVLGGIWEMTIAAIELPANNGTRVFVDRRQYDHVGTVQTTWNRSGTSKTLPYGAFSLDMDSNANGVIFEGFSGREGDMLTRNLGPRQKYTPDLFTVSGKPPAQNRKGFWRYIAPGTVSFSASFYNTTTTPVKVTAGWFMAFTLPVTASKSASSTFTGVLSNPEARNGLPNLVSITAQTRLDFGNTCALYYPNSLNVGEGLDGLATIPGMSDLTISGVYETNDFESGVIGGV